MNELVNHKKGYAYMSEESRFWYRFQFACLKRWLQSEPVLRLTQQIRLMCLLKHLRSQIPYYQHRKENSFRTLPIIDKSMVQDNFQQMNVLGLSFQEAHALVGSGNRTVYAQQSSGTSGSPGIYLYSPQEMQQALISTLSKILPSFLLKAPKIAIFHLSKNSYFPKDLTMGFQWQDFDLHQHFEENLIKLQLFSPDVIIAPAQTLCKLAKLQKEKTLSLNVKRIISTQEVMTAMEEKLIESGFAQQIYQLYQCAEGWLGATCEQGSFHIDEDQFLVEKEWIDEAKERFIPVITTLHRRVQPLVRYRMEDILSMKSTPCPCGSPMLAFEKIVGRCEDMFYFSDHNSAHVLKPIYSDRIHLSIHRANGNIHQYQLFQHSPHHIVIKMRADDIALAKESIEEQFKKLSLSHGVKCPVLEFLPLDPLPLNQMFRQTQRLIKIPH